MSTELATAYVRIRPSTAGFRQEATAAVKRDMVGVTAAAGGLGRASGAATRGVGALGAESIATSGAVKGLTRQIGFATAAMVGGAGIVGAFKASVDGAEQFQGALSQIEGLVGESHRQVTAWGEQLKKLGPELGRSPQELAEALYFVTSAGIKGSRAIDAVVESAKAASAGLGDTQVIADAVTSAMNAYWKTNLTAANATDVMTAAVREGKIEADALAPVLGVLLPTASAMGISFAQVAGTLAVFSRTGLDASEAATSLQQIMATLLKPTRDSEKALNSVGLSSRQLTDIAISGPKGLINALRILNNAFGDNQDALAQIFPNIRAFRGVMNALAQDSKTVDHVLYGVANSTGDAQHAFEIASKTASFKFHASLSRVKAEAITLGTKALPGLEKAVDKTATGLIDLAENQDVHSTLHDIGVTALAAGKGLLFLGKAAGSITGSVGVAPILAAAAAYKALGIARKAYVATSARVAAATAGGATAASAETAATTAAAEATLRLAAATEANTAALNFYAVSAGRATGTTLTLAGANTVAATSTQAAAAAATELAAAETATAAAGTAAATGGIARLGTAALALAGGPLGLAIIATAALAGGIVYLARRHDAWDRANETTTSSLDRLNESLQRSKDLAHDFSITGQDIASAKIGVKAAQLAVEQAKKNQAASKAAPGSIEARSLAIGVAQAQDQLARAIQAVSDAERAHGDVVKAQSKTDRDRNVRVREGVQGILDLRAADKKLDSQLGGGVGLKHFLKQLDDAVEKLHASHPAAARARQALAVLVRETQNFPTPKEIDVVVRGVAKGEKLARILEDLGYTKEQAAALATPVGAAVGSSFAQAMKAGVVGGAPDIFSAVNAITVGAGSAAAVAAAKAAADRKKKAATEARQRRLDEQKGALAADQAAAEKIAATAATHAKNELKAAKKHLEVVREIKDTRDRILEQASQDLRSASDELASRRDDLVTAKEAIVAAQQALAEAIKSGQQSVNDAVTQAKQNLNTLGSSLAGSISDFLSKTDAAAGPAKKGSPLSKRFKQLRDQLLEGQGGPETQRAAKEIAAKLQADQAKPKAPAGTASTASDRVRRQLADLTNDLNKGAVKNLAAFNKRLDAILKKSGVTAAKVRAKEGTAAADQFNANIAGVRQQAVAELAGPKRSGSGLEPTVVKPLDAVAAAQKETAKATTALANAQHEASAAASSVARAQVEEAKKHTGYLRALARDTAIVRQNTSAVKRVWKAKTDKKTADEMAAAARTGAR